MSPITTLHNTARSEVENALLDMNLTPAEVAQYTPNSAILSEEDETTRHDNNNKKQKNRSNNATSTSDFDIDDYTPLVLPTFYLSSSTVSYRNGKLRVKTTSFEVKYHLDHANTLKLS